MDEDQELVLYGVEKNWTIYCKRVVCYLRAKGIEDKVSWMYGKFEEGLTAPLKPPGQVPMLRITNKTTGEHSYVHESTAIIEYLEDVFPQEPRLRGHDAFEVSQTRGMISCAESAISSFLMYVLNSSELMATMGRHQDKSAARSFLAAGHRSLNNLERIASKKGPLLCDHQRLSTADIVVAVSLGYVSNFYGYDAWEGRPRLQSFWDAVKNQPCLAYQEWEAELPPFKEFARIQTVAWKDLSESEKSWAADNYASQSKTASA